MAAQFRSAVIGCGRTASQFEDDPLRRKPASHMGHYRKHRNVRVVAGADTDPERLRDFRKRWRVKQTFSDYRDMLETVRPDIVSLTAYAPERHTMFKHCVEAGVKAVWVEKAIATSLRDARAMVRLARKHEVATAVNHPRRWSAKYIRARDLVRAGAIGTPESIVSTFSGNLIHTGTHAFDVMRFVFGDVVAVRGTPDPGVEGLAYQPGREILDDIGGNGTLRFANGAVGTINARAKDYFVFEFEILGSTGSIRLGNATPLTLLKPAPAGYATQFEDLARVDDSEVLPTRSSRRQGSAIGDLVAELTHGIPGTNSIEEGYKALEIALGFHESFKSGGDWVSLPLKPTALKINSR